MNGRQFALYLARDLSCYCGCQGREDTLVPQHRANRGMGSVPSLDVPSNIIVMCSELNGLIESNADWARRARIFGWKILKWKDPAETPVYHAGTQEWLLLDNNFQRTITQEVAA